MPPASPHAWVITAEDGTRLTIPLGAEGADGLFDALSPLPGIDFDAGIAAVAARRPRPRHGLAKGGIARRPTRRLQTEPARSIPSLPCRR